MLGDGRLRQPEVLGELADTVLTSAQVLEDGQPHGVGEDGEEVGELRELLDGVRVACAVGRQGVMNHRHMPIISASGDMSRGVRRTSARGRITCVSADHVRADGSRVPLWITCVQRDHLRGART